MKAGRGRKKNFSPLEKEGRKSSPFCLEMGNGSWGLGKRSDYHIHKEKQ